jgi:hypothetical protein
MTAILCVLLLTVATTIPSAGPRMNETLIQGYLTILLHVMHGGSSVDDTHVIDITGIECLTNGEKAELTKRMVMKSTEPLRFATFDQLVEEGLIVNNGAYFPTGTILEIKSISYNEKTKEIRFRYENWKGNMGAMGSDDASATFNGEKWTFDMGASWIS